MFLGVDYINRIVGVQLTPEVQIELLGRMQLQARLGLFIFVWVEGGCFETVGRKGGGSVHVNLRRCWLM